MKVVALVVSCAMVTILMIVLGIGYANAESVYDYQSGQYIQIEERNGTTEVYDSKGQLQYEYQTPQSDMPTQTTEPYHSTMNWTETCPSCTVGFPSDRK